MAVNPTPISLSEADQTTMASILDAWIEEGLKARYPMEMEWKEDLRTYMAMPKSQEKNFPWKGASNLVIPMKAIVADSIQARLHAAIYDKERVWQADTLDPEFVEDAQLCEEVLDMEARNRLQLERKTAVWEGEAILHGTSFLKGMWLDDRRLVRVSLANEQSEFQEVFDHYGPDFSNIAIEDIVVPPGAAAINGANRCQWIDHVSPLRWDQLKDRERYGYNKAVIERIKGEKYSDWQLELKETRDQLQGINRIRREGFDIHEVWCNFPIYELDKFPDRKVPFRGKTYEREWVELVITYHHRTKSIVRVLENWNEIAWRPFFSLNYIRRANCIYGLGIGRAIHSMTEGVDTIHNQRIDNSTVANTRIWKARKGAFARGTSISPSKILFMDNPKEDLIPEAHGDVYPSSHQNEQVLRDYIERRTGINDYNLGREDPAGRYSATATSTQLLLKEGTRKFDFIIADWRQDWGILATWLVSQYKQYGYHYQEFLVQQLGMEKATRFMLALDRQSSQPTFAVFKFLLSAATVSDSKQVRMEENMLMIDVTERIYGQVLLLAGNITRGFDQNQMPFTDAQKMIAWDAIEAGLTLYKRILQALNVKDQDKYLITPEVLQEAIFVGARQSAINQAETALLGTGGSNIPGLPPGGAGPGAPPPGQGGAGTQSPPVAGQNPAVGGAS
jgi:hypothetical protein